MALRTEVEFPARPEPSHRRSDTVVNDFSGGHAERTMDDSMGGAKGAGLTEITNLAVALHREQFGRGPAAARCYLVDDLLVCVLSDPFTPAEKRLIDPGEFARVREMRAAHRDVTKADCMRRLEAELGRGVEAQVSTVNAEPDLRWTSSCSGERGGLGAGGVRPAPRQESPAVAALHASSHHADRSSGAWRARSPSTNGSRRVRGRNGRSPPRRPGKVP